jgi:plastocyanin
MTTVERPAVEPADEQTELTVAHWLPVQRGVAWTVVAAGLFLQGVMARTVIVPVLVLMAIFAIAGAVSFRRPRAGVITIGVLGLLSVLAFLPDIFRDMARPESAFTFVVTGVITVAALIGVVGGAATLLRRDPPGLHSTVPAIGVVAVLAMLAIGVFARLTLESDAALPGDVQVIAEDVEFTPETLSASAGTVGVHVENRDLGHHDFTIEELDVSLELPERASRRVTFEAPAGVYEVICTLPGHESMTATLTVT